MLEWPESMVERYLNAGFSGGEKKRNEILQMLMLDPSYIIMDETDSGLDVDALKIVSKGSTACAVQTSAASSSPTTSACWITSCLTKFTSL